MYHLSLQLPLYTSSPRYSGLPGLYYVVSSVLSEDSLLHILHLDQNMLLLSIFGLIYLIIFFSLNSSWSAYEDMPSLASGAQFYLELGDALCP